MDDVFPVDATGLGTLCVVNAIAVVMVTATTKNKTEKLKNDSNFY